ncbi:hypothetical protein GS432_04095 [Rhodococcus hoagii]|nr:hypothetical protein [Prescottella equi]
MLTAVGGGGGIGMQACFTPEALRAAYDTVQRIGGGELLVVGRLPGTFRRPARVTSVQVFGDGAVAR